jgi:hypothetical protein
MSYTQDLSENDVFSALRAFILDTVGGLVTEVVRLPANRVPMPKNQPYITMSPVLKDDIMRPVVAGISDPVSQPQSRSLTAATRYQIQIDVFGAGAGDLIQMLYTVWESPDAFDFFNALTPAGVYPIYATPPRQVPLVDDEDQYEVRWMMDVSLQYNPTLTNAVQTASTATVTLINVEASYH